MNLERRPRIRLDEEEWIDRRILGAFTFVDAITRVPVAIGGSIPEGERDERPPVEVRRASVAGVVTPRMLARRDVRITRNRSGVYVITSAPGFDAYAHAFENPQAPAITQAGPFGLHVSVIDPGPHHLPLEFRFDVPRDLNPTAADSVFQPLEVRLFRAPAAPVLDGWVVLRVRVTQATTGLPLPGVLLTAFRRPRGGGDQPIGAGMTDWRGMTRGEALLPLTGLQRFRPGSSSNVIETDHAITFEAARDSRFTGAANELPDVRRIVEGTGGRIIRAVNEPPNPQLQISITRPAPPPPPPMRVQAGREYVVDMTMP